MGQEEKLDIKFVIDKKKKRVVYAEVDKHFVDALFGFLTLPLGIIVELLDKKSNIGCIDKFYESIEKIDDQYFQTKACKSMILSPNSESDVLCQTMKIRYNKKWRVKYYLCSSWDCVVNKSSALLSSTPNSRCTCGKIMGDESYSTFFLEERGRNGVFLKDGLFMVTDDLHVMQSTHNNLLDLLNMLEISDSNLLEEKALKLDKNEILRLLGTCFTSKTALTDTFLDGKMLINNAFNCHEFLFSLNHIFNTSSEDAIKCRKINPNENFKPFIDSQEVVDQMKVTLSLVRNRVTKEVIYMIGGGNMIDILFSFFTFSLSSIIKLLGEKKLIELGSVIILYESLLNLVSYTNCMKSNVYISPITEPKIASHHGSNNQLMKIKEHVRRSCNITVFQMVEGLSLYPESKGKSVPDQIKATYINPKSPESTSDVGGTFVKQESKFIVTNKFEVIPFCAMSVLNVIKASKTRVDSLEEEKVIVTEAQVLKLLQQCLISDNIFGAFSN